MEKKAYRIGIDFGGVLSQHDKTHLLEDRNRQQHRNVQIDMPFAIESLQQLKADGHSLLLISFCGRQRGFIQ
jgi:hypothetical protein